MNTTKFIEKQVEDIRKIVGKGKAISALSGGVDSSACTVLAHKALGDQLKVIFIDDGLMRAGEPEEVGRIFARLGIEVEVIDTKKDFFSALKGKVDPEEKRKAFRYTFYKIFGREVLRSKAVYLIQGTIAADIIETKGGVKTQHNILEQIGIDPEKGFGFKVIEPLKELFKPQVREVARELGLPESISNRMPFPGPALATRIIGEVTPERVEVVRKATRIVEAELAPLKPFQAFAALMSDRGTGIADGKRKFGHVIIIRSVESTDAMTAQPTQVPWDILLRLSKRITTEIPDVTRVAYELTSKPPATIEYI
ncbi:MAG TPA: glutamine-hydrolyzing GMP synthase [Candidatus Aminicenantes bacterium]|nr:glutamine-hydrolyzing GMP synthase [Acidobacteriota bacterium]HOI44219.1 glutamine-hydrolyzing GMP synthase [Candidatus Aminicenantes bacterium]